MWKKWNLGLNIVMGAFFGTWLGYALWTWWDFRTHPDLYEVQSVPWYTGLLVRGAVVICVLLLGFSAKFLMAVLQWRQERRNGS